MAIKFYMYIFNIKDDGVKLDIVITRSMLAIAAIAAFFYNSAENYYLNIISAVVLFMAAIFIHFLIDKLRLTKFILFASAAILFFISTRSIAFSLILLSYGYLIKYFNKKPIIQVSADGITISKLFSNKMYLWDEFANLIFKDSLLTLDFKNNKLIQLKIDENEATVDENEFNDFCRRFI